MNDQEREQVLRMIEAGRMTPEAGLCLMQALEQSAADDENGPIQPAAISFPAHGPQAGPRVSLDPDAQQGMETDRAVWLCVPLATGTLMMVLGVWIVSVHMQPTAFNIWSLGLGLPLLLAGVLLIVAASACQRTRWVYVRVEQEPGRHPHTIVLGFPLPLRLTAWILRTLGYFVPELDDVPLEEIFNTLHQAGDSAWPLVISVDEGHHGERVQAYIG